MPINLKKIKDADNNLNFVIGYRNLYNIASVVVAFGFLIESQSPLLFGTVPGAIEGTGGVILMVLGLKWFLTQIRENLDTLEIKELQSKNQQ
jgi:hypothetical protein